MELPDDWYEDIDSRSRMLNAEKVRAEIERLRAALQGVVSDVLEYERVNNLVPNPGRKYCWDSVDRAQVALGHEQERQVK